LEDALLDRLSLSFVDPYLLHFTHPTLFLMHTIDWTILVAILAAIVGYGVWKSRGIHDTHSFLVGDKNLKWWTIGLSVMATQASAITFLSTPGQAYEEGMGFAQFYFGLPIAMVILCVFVLPILYRLNVFTAYEYLEQRFDVKTRTLTASLFLISRGLAAGITIFAPAIILSSILGWSLGITTLLIGILVVIYTVAGGSEAVSQTQKQQMIIILGGMVVAFFVIVSKLPQNVSLDNALQVAGKMDKLNVIDFKFDLKNKYNIWSALFGGTFLFLSYFGTDQSQVQRYLSGRTLTESRLGLLFNGLFKVPMQFMVLFVGLMVFMFYQFNPSPLHFNAADVEQIKSTTYAKTYESLEEDLAEVYELKKSAIHDLVTNINAATPYEQETVKVNGLMKQEKVLRDSVRTIIKAINKQDPKSKMDHEDGDYVFISFIMKHLPIGLIGLLLAVIFSAAMSTTASELNALATTSVIDIYKRFYKPEEEDQHYLRIAKLFTVLWGVIALSFAMFASLFDNLIEAVNIIGSLFYGTILGIFAIAFFFKKVNGNAVFKAALIGEVVVVTLFILDKNEVIDLPYLYLNMIGCVLVVLLANLLNNGNPSKELA